MDGHAPIVLLPVPAPRRSCQSISHSNVTARQFFLQRTEKDGGGNEGKKRKKKEQNHLVLLVTKKQTAVPSARTFPDGARNRSFRSFIYLSRAPRRPALCLGLARPPVTFVRKCTHLFSVHSLPHLGLKKGKGPETAL